MARLDHCLSLYHKLLADGNTVDKLKILEYSLLANPLRLAPWRGKWALK